MAMRLLKHSLRQALLLIFVLFGLILQSAFGAEQTRTRLTVAAASQLAENAVAHNYLSHEEWQEWQRLGKARAACAAGEDCQNLQEKISTLYRLDLDRDKTLATCQDSGSPACLREVAKVYDAFQSYGKKPQLSSAYVKVATQYGETKQRYMGDIGKEALIDIVKDSLESPVAIADLAYHAYKGDEAAQSRLHAMGEEIAAFTRSPVNHVSESMRERLALADKLDSQGRTRDADLVRTELYLSSGLTAIGGVTGVAKLPVALGKGALRAGKKVGPEGIPPKFSGFDKDNLSFDTINKQIDNLDISVGKDQAVFYSGRGAREAAENFANKNNLTTLEQTSGGKALDNLKLFDGIVADINFDKASGLWGNISSNFANQAKGKVTAIVNDPHPASIFIKKELPALLKNSDVTEVVVRSTSGKSVSIPKGTPINDALEMIKGF